MSAGKAIHTWRSEEGPAQDVIVSTRARLARNLAAFRFPGRMAEGEEEALRAKVREAFAADPELSVTLAPIELSSLGPRERQALAERSLVSPNYALEGANPVFSSHDERLCAIVNEIDHLRVSAFEPGLALAAALRGAEGIESRLERRLAFAASEDIGYLTTELRNLGTGLRVSALLHLPALVETGFLEKALKAVMGLGLEARGFFGTEGVSLGSLYQVANLSSIGSSESELVLLIERTASQLAEFERKAREELLKQKKLEVLDAVYRAQGILLSARKMGYQEAVELLSRLRLGVCLGVIQGPAPRQLDELICRAQKSHLQLSLPEGLADVDTVVEEARATLLRETIGRKGG
jgi:protein arginine kinase